MLFWGPEWENDPEQQAAAAALRSLFHQLGGSSYGCSWREWELPGSPIGAGSYLGDEVILTEPVGAGQPLDDTDIQARIVTEVTAQRAPAATDDTVYVVAPRKGVPVQAGLETGCGGTNFTFCAYHDSFTQAGVRFRYAVLPYPCTQGGNTCFVDTQEDPGHALEAGGSHELAEAVTDPDQPPVGNGGWFEDRSGAENADLCESEACLAELTAGPDTFTLNSLWSNLAGGCVASAPCAPPPVECTDPAPGACVVNERAAEGCALEWLVDPNLTLDRAGLPGSKVACADGQPFCDADGAQNGACTFRVAVCLGNRDPRLACTPSPVSAVRLSARLASSADPVDQANASALIDALAHIDPSSTGSASGGTVSFTPPASTPNACSGYLDIVVPAGAHGGGATGTRALGLTAQTSGGLVRETLKLLCEPSFP